MIEKWFKLSYEFYYLSTYLNLYTTDYKKKELLIIRKYDFLSLQIKFLKICIKTDVYL